MNEASNLEGDPQAGAPSEKPFARLIRHSIDRILHAGETSDPGELEFGIGTMLALLATPGAFASMFLADKYGSLFQFLRGEGKLNPYVASLPDEYFFIVLAMVVTGAVAIWKWDALIPDHRDYANLAPLPIPSGHILLANVAALVFLSGALCADVNAASSVLLPLIVCGSESSVRYVAVFFGTHLLSVVLASAFSFFTVLAILGLLMAALPYRWFRKCSVYIRCSMIIFLMTMLSTSFIVVKVVQSVSSSSLLLLRPLPPVWFLGLCQHLRGIPDPAFASLAQVAIMATAASAAVALGAYAVSYRHCFTQSAEMVTSFALKRGKTESRKLAWLDALFLKSPFERACFQFSLKTLFRSENHTLVLGGFTGLGVVIASQTLFEAAKNSSSGPNAVPRADLLSVPLILAYFLLLGLRFAFEIPVVLRANWILRFTVNPETNECIPLARKVMLTFLTPLLTACFATYTLRWSAIVGLIHTATVAVLCLLLIEILLVRFRKIPFTCSMPTFKSNALVFVLFYLIGFVAFTSGTSNFEQQALEEPLWWLALIPLLAGIWLALKRYRQEMICLDRRLIFEERPEVAVEVLDLTISR